MDAHGRETYADQTSRLAERDRNAPGAAQNGRSARETGIECRMSRERSRLQLTVLGKSPSWQDVGGACSGYLVQEEDFALLLDCGNGVFSKLRRFCDYVDVDAVLVSHLHADHFLDLVPFSYALTYAPRQQPVDVEHALAH